MAGDAAGRRREMRAAVDRVRIGLADAHSAREVALPACRRAIRASGSSIRAVHRGEADRAAALAAEAAEALREAQEALRPHPGVAHAGFLHDAEREVAEAHLTAALVGGGALPGPGELGVDGAPWLKALAEAASELRRSALDRLREGDLARAEDLLGAMDDAYDVLVTVDYPDALTEGLRRTVDALRAVVDRRLTPIQATPGRRCRRGPQPTYHSCMNSWTTQTRPSPPTATPVPTLL
jgi:translin